MARMMNSIMYHRNYCQYGCCTNIPLWRPKDNGVARRTQRSREKRQWKKETRML